MNILILNWRDIRNPGKGGAEIILYEFCKRLIRQGHTITWFSSFFSGGKKIEKYEGVNIVRKGNELTVYFHACFYYKNLQQKPDLVLDCVNTVCWQTPLYIPQEKRLLYANQSAREVFFYEYIFPFSLICYLLEPLQYLTYKNTSALCYSSSIKKDLIDFGIKSSLINVFPLGLDHIRYKPRKKSKEPLFIFVARFVKNKRPNLCITAFRELIKKYSSASLYLIGYGKEESKLKELITKFKLEKNIFIINKSNVFLSKNNMDVKVKLMQQAWSLLLPSVKEGWGMVVTEAAACGTPAIVSNVTGLKDSVIHNKTGIILSSNPTKKELLVAMEKIINNNLLRHSLSEQAVAFAKKFSWGESFKAFYFLLIKKYNQSL